MCARTVRGIGGRRNVRARAITVGWGGRLISEVAYEEMRMSSLRTITFPFNPPTVEPAGLPSPTGRFLMLPVPLPLTGFPELPVDTSLLVPLTRLAHVPVGGRHKTQ
jgi:hypothetical protein